MSDTPPPAISRRSTVTEEYRVPDGMVGLSECGGVRGGGARGALGIRAVCGGQRSPPMVPFSLFPPVIGRGGEQINKIQQDSGCKVQISPGKGGAHHPQHTPPGVPSTPFFPGGSSTPSWGGPCCVLPQWVCVPGYSFCGWEAWGVPSFCSFPKGGVSQPPLFPLRWLGGSQPPLSPLPRAGGVILNPLSLQISPLYPPRPPSFPPQLPHFPPQSESGALPLSLSGGAGGRGCPSAAPPPPAVPPLPADSGGLPERSVSLTGSPEAVQ